MWCRQILHHWFLNWYINKKMNKLHLSNLNATLRVNTSVLNLQRQEFCLCSQFFSTSEVQSIHSLPTHPTLWKSYKKTTGLCCLTTALTVGTSGLKLPGIPRDKSGPESARSLQQLWELLGTLAAFHLHNTSKAWILQLISWLPRNSRFYLHVMQDFRYVDLCADMTLKETTKQWLEANNVRVINWNLASSLV